MKPLLARIVVLAISFLIVDAMMDTVTVSGGFIGALGLGVLYGLVSGLIGTVLRLLSLPLMIITLGLFEFVINAFLLLLTDWLTDWLEVDGFMSALGAAVILSIASALVGLAMSALVPGTRSS
jgi:putative membrane protein